MLPTMDAFAVKICTKCGALKCRSEFHRNNSKDGMYPSCKACQSAEYKRRYREDPEHRERQLARSKEWYWSRRGDKREYDSWRLLKKYGLTPETYRAVIARIGSVLSAPSLLIKGSSFMWTTIMKPVLFVVSFTNVATWVSGYFETTQRRSTERQNTCGKGR